MTGIHADWFTDPKKVRIAVASTFALALAVRAIAGFLVQHLLEINRTKRNLRYRIPLALAHPRRSRESGGPVQGTRKRNAAATVNRGAP